MNRNMAMHFADSFSSLKDNMDSVGAQALWSVFKPHESSKKLQEFEANCEDGLIEIFGLKTTKMQEESSSEEITIDEKNENIIAPPIKPEKLIKKSKKEKILKPLLKLNNLDMNVDPIIDQGLTSYENNLKSPKMGRFIPYAISFILSLNADQLRLLRTV